MGKKPVVQLETFLGRELNYDAEKNIKNERSVVKLTHDTVEWKNFMTHLKVMGYAEVRVFKVVDYDTGKKIADKSLTKDIKNEVKEAYHGKPRDTRTPEQIQIDELNKKVEELSGKKKPKKKDPKDDGADEIKELRATYRDLYKKGPGPSWGVDKLKEMIEAKQ